MTKSALINRNWYYTVRYNAEDIVCRYGFLLLVYQRHTDHLEAICDYRYIVPCGVYRGVSITCKTEIAKGPAILLVWFKQIYHRSYVFDVDGSIEIDVSQYTAIRFADLFE